MTQCHSTYLNKNIVTISQFEPNNRVLYVKNILQPGWHALVQVPGRFYFYLPGVGFVLEWNHMYWISNKSQHKIYKTSLLLIYIACILYTHWLRQFKVCSPMLNNNILGGRISVNGQKEESLASSGPQKWIRNAKWSQIYQKW